MSCLDEPGRGCHAQRTRAVMDAWYGERDGLASKRRLNNRLGGLVAAVCRRGSTKPLAEASHRKWDSERLGLSAPTRNWLKTGRKRAPGQFFALFCFLLATGGVPLPLRHRLRSPQLQKLPSPPLRKVRNPRPAKIPTRQQLLSPIFPARRAACSPPTRDRTSLPSKWPVAPISMPPSSPRNSFSNRAQPFSEQKVNQTADAIKSAGKFDGVRIDVNPEADGVRVIYVVEPAVYFGIFKFPGAEQFPYSRLVQVSNYPIQAPFNSVEVETDRLGAAQFLPADWILPGRCALRSRRSISSTPSPTSPFR